ncbi:homoserine O-acetyltransferase [Mytilus galloprovincialis]|nr:homoserine O-acetyltransferase [Mytilus galloprovincialis]
MRYLQRKAIMSDPNWNKGHYYGAKYPKMGMKLAREIATITYRSGPEWDRRFNRDRIDTTCPPTLCPTFSIESYLEHQGESFSTKYDPNSLLYISKAMDLFDIAESYESLHAGLSRVNCPVMVIGVQTDILFPIRQQRKLATALQESGNPAVTFYELNSLYGHDTFLLDLNGVGAAVKGFLETDLRESGIEVPKSQYASTFSHKKDRVLF